MQQEIFYTYLLSFLVFVAVVALLEGIYFAWRAIHEEGSIKINKRLKALSAAGEGHKKAVELLRKREMSGIPVINRLLMSIPRLHSLDRLLQQSAVELSVSRFLLLQLFIFAALLFVFSLLTSVHIVIGVMIALPVSIFLPILYLMRKRQARSEAFLKQLPDALDYLARSLRAGNPFSASLKSLAAEMPDPIGTEFGITFEELNYGLEFDEALKNLARRSGSEEMNYFVTAVLIQRTTGGNLADMLNRLSAIMRSRAATYREIRILSAEMKMSANVLVLLPFFVAAVMSVTNPGYLSILFTTTVGHFLILGQLALMAIGYYIIRRMISFRV
ncbi:MAG TPA: type II secretion system F family protein [Gammaproteobacteria bacterium]